MRNKGMPQHLTRNFTHLFRRLAHVDATSKSVSECSFAASAGMDLRFDHDFALTNLPRDMLRTIWCRCDAAACRGHSELVQQLLRLILVNIHEGSAVSTKRGTPPQ